MSPAARSFPLAFVVGGEVACRTSHALTRRAWLEKSRQRKSPQCILVAVKMR